VDSKTHPFRPSRGRLPHLVGVALLFFVLMAGCACPERVTLKAVKPAVALLGAEYVRYVQADERLTPDERVTRIRTLELIQKALAETKR
jgi:hypothetical protein